MRDEGLGITCRVGVWRRERTREQPGRRGGGMRDVIRLWWVLGLSDEGAKKERERTRRNRALNQNIQAAGYGSWYQVPVVRYVLL